MEKFKHPRRKLIERLEPFAQGCFTGRIDEWPQLKPLLKDIYSFLVAEQLADDTGAWFEKYPPGGGWDTDQEKGTPPGRCVNTGGANAEKAK